jgi:hypothetical protein
VRSQNRADWLEELARLVKVATAITKLIELIKHVL